MERPRTKRSQLIPDTNPEARTAPSSEGVKSAARAIQLLEYFDVVQRGANVGELAHTLGFPQSSTSLLLQTLNRAGYLNFDRRTREYHLSERVRLLGNWICPELFDKGRLQDVMQELSRKARGTTILAARLHLHAQYIHVVHGKSGKPNGYKGEQRLLMQSSTGQALLSLYPDDEVVRLTMRANAEKASDQERVKVDELMARIRSIRRLGYSVGNDAIETCSIVAVPLRVQDRPALSLAVAGPKVWINKNAQIVAEMMRSAIARHRTDNLSTCLPRRQCFGPELIR